MNFKDNTLAGILRSLAADEFLAWMQYYFAEVIAQGKALNFSNKVFNETGKDELDDHYKKLTTWMQSNAILVPTDFAEMMKICNTPYFAFGDGTDTGTLIQHQITAEQEAIDAYTQAMIEPEVTKYPDLVVMLGEICADEREHLKELTDVMSQIANRVPLNFAKVDARVKARELKDTLASTIAELGTRIQDSQDKIDDLTEIKSIDWSFVGSKDLDDKVKIKYLNKSMGLVEYIKSYCYSEKYLEVPIEDKNVTIHYYYSSDCLIILEEGMMNSLLIYSNKGTSVDSQLLENLGIEIVNFSTRINRISALFSTDPNKECYVVFYKDEDGESEFKGTYDECQKFIESSEARVSSGEKFELISGPDKC